MSEASEDRVCELLVQSLAAWRLEGSVERTSGAAILVHSAAIDIRIERAPENLPFRWVIGVDGRRRGAISLVAVLRQLRAALDPGYTPHRVRVAASPEVPS